jgi:hypothetical protein
MSKTSQELKQTKQYLLLRIDVQSARRSDTKGKKGRYSG